MKHSVALVGFGGFGASHLKTIIKNPMEERYSFDAAVDLYPENAPGYPWLVENKIPIYSSLTEMYKNHAPDYVIISTPVMSHLPMITEAMENGSHVFCEKPIFPRIQDAYTAEKVIKKSGKILSVGFNWSYTKAMTDLKNDIISGVFGAPVRLSGCVIWQRFDRYFSRPWAGKYKLPTGEFVCDSVVSNATSHFLHNILWLLGKTLNSSAMPDSVLASVYRAKDIETFDTAFIKGKISGGEFYFSASHSMDSNTNTPYINYEFENATIKYEPANAPRLTAYLKNGTIKDYSLIDESHTTNNTKKTLYVLDIIDGLAPECCGLDAAIPHLKISNAIFEKCPVNFFPEELKIRIESASGMGLKSFDEGAFIKGLAKDMLSMYENNLMPNETDALWAAESTGLGSLSEYNEFKDINPAYNKVKLPMEEC